jgi:hypothetical protein
LLVQERADLFRQSIAKFMWPMDEVNVAGRIEIIIRGDLWQPLSHPFRSVLQSEVEGFSLRGSVAPKLPTACDCVTQVEGKPWFSDFWTAA